MYIHITIYILLPNQWSNIFTKSLKNISYDSMGTKLGKFDLYTLDGGEVLVIV